MVSLKEQVSEDISIDHSEALWDLELFQYGSNLLAGIGGGTVSPGSRPSQAGGSRSAIGGALSGAAAGAMAGSTFGPYGMAIGGAIGAIGGLMSS